MSDDDIRATGSDPSSGIIFLFALVFMAGIAIGSYL